MENTINPSNNICLCNYLHSLSQTPYKLKKRLLATWTPDQELNQVRQRSGADMKRKLSLFDLVALGLGGMLGVGVFVTTGPVARTKSGPAVFISYIIAGISALLSSMCYSEFSIAIPVAGGAFSYLRVTFGMNYLFIFITPLSYPCAFLCPVMISFFVVIITSPPYYGPQ